MKRRGAWLLLVILLAVAAAVWWRPFSSEVRSSSGGRHAVAVEISPETLLASALQSMDSGALRRELTSGDPDAVLAAIREFLVSGKDAATGEEFRIGPYGDLAGAPTLRVLLLDRLGRICRDRRSDEAGAISRELLETKTTADEWAVALRNVGWATPDDHAYLSRKVGELIDHEPWRREASAGYCEAFDVIVFVRDTRFIPTLNGMVEGADERLRFTAATTLDRLAGADPGAVMDFLNARPDVLADHPMLVADHFAKADLSQPAQRAAVERWLDRDGVDIDAREKLIGSLGQPGVFVSDNLLTPRPAAGGLSKFQEQALGKTLAEWLESGRWPDLAGALKERLGGPE